MRPTKRELRIIELMRDYRAIRNRSFGKSIPPVENVAFILLSKSEMLRLTGEEGNHGCSLSVVIKGVQLPFIVGLAEDDGEIVQRTTLVHEMAHFKVNLKFGRDMRHGKNFNAEMRRLVRIGELDGWL